MRCSLCGTELERPGQGHTCRSAVPVVVEPPTGWVVTTWVVLAFAALYLVVALLAAKVALDLPATLEPSGGRRTWTVVVTLAWVLVIVGTVVSQLIWNRRTRRLAELYGFDGSLAARHLFIRVYAATVLVTGFLQPLLHLDKRGAVALIATIRVAAGLAFAANVLIGRARLLRLIADSARQSEQARQQTSAPPARPTDRDLDELWSRTTRS